MTATTYPATHAAAGTGHRFLHGLAAAFRGLGDAIRAAHAAESLLGLSDAELARRGLRREEIMDTVFRRYLDRD
jgi:hypothetical protein